LFLSLPGFLEARVIQNPRHLVKGKGGKAKMGCTPKKGHNFVFWYQQNQNKVFYFLSKPRDF
jgi:T-cell receptor beta chain V region